MEYKSSRKEAKAAGDSHYLTGKPCKHGHIAKRSTLDGNCTQCRYEARVREREAFQALVERKKMDAVTE